MFSTNLLCRLTKLYTYPCSKGTSLLPLNCTSSIRSFTESSKLFSSITAKIPTLFVGKVLIQKYKPLRSYATWPVRPSSDRNSTKNPLNTAKDYSYATRHRNQAGCSSSQSLPGKVSTLQGLKEFFSHPLTWDRNNGFLNILLGLVIFGYCFCSSCDPVKPKGVATESVENE